jgi:hypothetical protein
MPLPPLGLAESVPERNKHLTVIQATTTRIMNHCSRITCGQVFYEKHNPIHVADHTPTRRSVSSSYNVTIL